MNEWWNITMAAIFGVAAMISLLKNKPPLMRGSKMFFIYIILCGMYITQIFDFKFNTRSDGNTVYELRYIFEALAIYIATASITCVNCKNTEITVIITAINALWALFHYFATISEPSDLVYWLFSLGVLIWFVAQYLTWSFGCHYSEEFYVEWTFVLLYSAATLLFHIAFILTQHGTGLIGTVWTDIFYIFNDIILWLFVFPCFSYIANYFSKIKRSDNNQPQKSQSNRSVNNRRHKSSSVLPLTSRDSVHHKNITKKTHNPTHTNPTKMNNV